ncbi:MAG: hypothetical protein U9P44_03650 [archaeon]|nr:hypothetical protein [archaeon]
MKYFSSDFALFLMLSVLFFGGCVNLNSSGNFSDECSFDSDCACSETAVGVCVNRTCKCITVVPAPVGFFCEAENDCVLWKNRCGCGCLNQDNDDVDDDVYSDLELCGLFGAVVENACLSPVCKCVVNTCVLVPV